MVLFRRPTKRFFICLQTDENGNEIARIRVDLFVKRNQPINYLIQLEIREDVTRNRWSQIIRYNYSKCISHRDIYTLNGKRLKDDIGVFKNLKTAVNYAVNDIKENWQNYIKYFRSGRKWKAG